VEKEPENTQYLEIYVRTLLARDRLDQASTELARLKELDATIAPQPWRTVELTARILHAQRKTEEAEALLVEYADKEDAPLLAVASLLEQIELNGMKFKAKKIYQKWLDVNSKKPESQLIMAGFLSRQNDLENALEVCDRVRTDPKTSPDLVQTVITAALEILYKTEADKSKQDREKIRVEKWISEALIATKDPQRQADLQQSRATLDNLQEQYDEAQKVYQDCLKQNPKDILAMNNLAWLLATRRQTPAKALALIEEAISQAGPNRELLDTLAAVYLAQNQKDYTARAVAELTEVVADQPTATGYFHLAQAYDQANRSDDAIECLRTALRLGLSENLRDLHPLERDRYKELLAKYAKALGPLPGAKR
jgi:tetratricopeptide (TPR) repeat protein